MVNYPRCYVCNQSEVDDPENVELRPYGKDGQWLCFDCMVADPEREAEAGRQFDAHCSKIDGGVVVLGDGAPRAATFEETSFVADVLPGLPKPGRS